MNRLCVSLAAVLLVAPLSALVSDFVPRAPVDPATLLQQYEGGQFHLFEAGLARIEDPAALRQWLETKSRYWIESAAPGDAARRRLVAASVALEAASATFEQWERARHLVEWGCRLLRDGGPPKPGERAWHLAAVALIERAFDAVFLAGLERYQPDRDSGRGKAIDHLRHAEARFPDEDRFRLARAVAHEMKAPGTAFSRRPVWVRPEDPPSLDPLPQYRYTPDMAQSVIAMAAMQGMPPPPAATHSIALWRLVNELRGLVVRPAIAAECNLRLGFTYLRLGLADLAVPHLLQAREGADDPFVLYISNLLVARIREDADDRAGAVAAYRAAHAIAPGAQSSALPLAALLFGGAQRDQAFTLVSGAIAGNRPAPDPWRLYGAGDARMWSALVVRLREATR